MTKKSAPKGSQFTLNPSDALHDLRMSEKAMPLYEHVKRFIKETVDPMSEKYFALAEKIGLVQYTVENVAGLDAMMEHLCELALAAAPGAVADSKELVRFLIDDVTRSRNVVGSGHVVDEHLIKETARRIASRRASNEGREGLAAFLEKRKPEWNG